MSDFTPAKNSADMCCSANPVIPHDRISQPKTFIRSFPGRCKRLAQGGARGLRSLRKAERFSAPPGSAFKQHVSSDGRWRVRPVRSDEIPSVAALQAEAFYEPLPVGPLNSVLSYGFQAEVLSGIRQKLSYAPQDGFTCLVAEDASAPQGIVGVVEVSLQSGKAELACLSKQGLEELVYAYVACMAVSPTARRKGIASALLRAAELQAGRWRQNWVLLHVYSSNFTGVSLYRSNGYAEVYRDPPWRRLFGQRQRILLAKGAAVAGAAGAIQSISGSVMRIFQQQQQQPEGRGEKAGSL